MAGETCCRLRCNRERESDFFIDNLLVWLHFMPPPPARETPPAEREIEFFIDNLLVRIHFIIVMIRWTGLAPWEFISLPNNQHQHRTLHGQKEVLPSALC